MLDEVDERQARPAVDRTDADGPRQRRGVHRRPGPAAVGEPTCSRRRRRCTATTPGLEQDTLLQAFYFTLPAERLAAGLTLTELGTRLRVGARLGDGIAATILEALGAFILLPYADAVPAMRKAVEAISGLDDEGLLKYGPVSIALTSALWDAPARRDCLERTAARGPGRRLAAAARPDAVEHVDRRAQGRHTPSGRAVHRAGAGPAQGDRVRRRPRAQPGAAGVVRGAAGAGRDDRRGCADARDGWRARLRADGAGRARPRRRCVRRRVRAAEAVRRRPVPPGDPAGVPRLRRGRGAQRPARRRPAGGGPPGGDRGGERLAVGAGSRRALPRAGRRRRGRASLRGGARGVRPDGHRHRDRPHPPAVRRVVAPGAAPPGRPASTCAWRRRSSTGARRPPSSTGPGASSRRPAPPPVPRARRGLRS